ncbi:UvrD-helicase domain-containing protein, partial [Acetobacter tropicalis]
MSACTPEQLAILAKSPTSSFKVVAGAGCGKTTTLVLFSEKWAGYKGLYLAFNSAIAREARSRFPRHIEARTAHSYAYQDLSIRALERERIIPRYTTRHIRQLEQELRMTAPAGSAETVLKTLTAFLISGGTKLTQAHCPEKDAKRNRAIRTFVAQAFKYIIRFENTTFPITHDVYLKRFEMDRKITGYDYIMVDEAQDLNPVLFSILEKSGLPVVA